MASLTSFTWQQYFAVKYLLNGLPTKFLQSHFSKENRFRLQKKSIFQTTHIKNYIKTFMDQTTLSKGRIIQNSLPKTLRVELSLERGPP